MSFLDKESNRKILFWSVVIAVIIITTIIIFTIVYLLREPVYTFEFRKNFKYGRTPDKPNVTASSMPLILGLKISGNTNSDEVWEKLLSNDVELFNKLLSEIHNGFIKIDPLKAGSFKSPKTWKTMKAKKSSQYDVMEITGTSFDGINLRSMVVKDGDYIFIS